MVRHRNDRCLHRGTSSASTTYCSPSILANGNPSIGASGASFGTSSFQFPVGCDECGEGEKGDGDDGELHVDMEGLNILT